MVSNENGRKQAKILKAKFGTDIRKSELAQILELTFNDLVLMMHRVFQIHNSSNILLKYRDSGKSIRISLNFLKFRGRLDYFGQRRRRPYRDSIRTGVVC